MRRYYKSLDGSGGMGLWRALAYRLFSPLWLKISPFFDEHPEALEDWPCWCKLCQSYSDD